MTAIATLCQANEVSRVLRALVFEIFEFLVIASDIFTIFKENVYLGL